MYKPILGLALAMLSSQSHCQKANPPTDCITAAAKYHSVNEDIVRAIIWGESRMRADARNTNANGSLDIGAAQTNSIHFPELRRLGVMPEHLLDGCTSVYVGAWMYSKHVARLGNTWEAVGAYNSLTPIFQQAYANSVAITLASWRKLPKAWLPFPAAPRSIPEALRIRNGSRPANTPPQNAASMVAIAE